MATGRLVWAFGTGLMGVLYLALVVTSVANGTFELRPTSLSVDAAQAEGLPADSQYLKVTDGLLVFSQAEILLEDDDAARPELKRLTVPVVSEALSAQWETSVAQGELLDAFRCWLLVSFEAEQVARLWPEVVEQVANGEPIEQPPVKMTLVGETIPVRHMVYQPHKFMERTKNFIPENARWMRFERHFNSLGRLVRRLCIGIALLLISVALFKRHRRLPDDVSRNVFDWSAVPGDSDSAPIPGDIDLDV